MKFLKSRAALPEPELRKAAGRRQAIDGWAESDVLAIYTAAPVRHLVAGEKLFADIPETESFFLLLDGSIQVVVKWDGHSGRPGTLRKGDCIAPLPKSPGLSYQAEAPGSCTVIEITPGILRNLPDRTQLAIYKVAIAATSRINAYIRAVNGEISSKNVLLASYIADQLESNRARARSPLVRDFVREMPRMPAYAMDLAVKLLDEGTSVQEVVEGIKQDPSLAGLVLSTVNSAQYGFNKKIENFYHACMILGFNSIYTVILTQAVQSAMPVSEATKQIQTHSCLISTLCYEIAKISKEVQAQTATTIGLLHDVGKGVRVLLDHAFPARAGQFETMDAPVLGGLILESWGLPPRVCRMVEAQQAPEFTPPELMASECRREGGVLHVAHVLESLLVEGTISPERTVYTKDYMGLLGLSSATPAELLRDHVLPSLVRNRHRLPVDIQQIIAKN